MTGWACARRAHLVIALVNKMRISFARLIRVDLYEGWSLLACRAAINYPVDAASDTLPVPDRQRKQKTAGFDATKQRQQDVLALQYQELLD